MVVIVYVLIDGSDQLRNAAENSTPNPLLCNVSEEALNHVQPGSASGCEVHMEALVPLQPALDFGMFVRQVVIGNYVNIVCDRHFSIDKAQKRDPILMRVTLPALTQNFAVQHI